MSDVTKDNGPEELGAYYAYLEDGELAMEPLHRYSVRGSGYFESGGEVHPH
jgi:hypothetical protein